jgi:hypothetical protein
VARAREVCYEPLIWLGSDELEELTGAEPSILRLVLPEAEEPRPA